MEPVLQTLLVRYQSEASSSYVWNEIHVSVWNEIHVPFFSSKIVINTFARCCDFRGNPRVTNVTHVILTHDSH